MASCALELDRESGRLLRKLTLVLTTVLGLVSLVAIAVVLAAALVRSEAGTRWVIDQAQAAMGESLAIGAVQGNLGDRLTLKGIRYTQAGMELDVASVDLSWHPAALLGGRLQVAELLVSGVQVQLFENEEAAPESAPFDPESLRPPVDISLARLSISDLAIVLPDGTRHPISSIEAALTVEGDDVQLTSLTADAPQGALAASLKAELNASLPLEGSLDWNAALPDGREAGGLLTLAGSAERLVIDHQGRGAVPLSLRGSASDLLGEPGWDIELSWPDSVLYSTPDQSVRGSGALASSGTLAAYTLAGNGVAAIPDVAPLSWAIDADGNSGELALEQLTLATSPYALQLDGRIGWASELTAELNYRASAADLQAIAAELPPQVDASGVVSVNYQTDQVQLDAFTLALAQSPATLQAKARLGLADTDNPELALDLEWQNLGWPLDTVADMQSPAGSLSINGVLQEWQALVSADVAGGQLPSG